MDENISLKLRRIPQLYPIPLLIFEGFRPEDKFYSEEKLSITMSSFFPDLRLDTSQIKSTVKVFFCFLRPVPNYILFP